MPCPLIGNSYLSRQQIPCGDRLAREYRSGFFLLNVSVMRQGKWLIFKALRQGEKLSVATWKQNHLKNAGCES